MTIVLILLILVFGLVAYLFFAPFFVEVDSTRSLYRFRFHRLMSVNVKAESDLTFELSVLGWKKQFKPTFYKATKKTQIKKAEVKQRSQSNVPVKKLLDLLKSFRFTKCYIRVGLEDMQMNGILYPVIAWLSWYSRKDIQVSFTGSNVVILEIKNNLARMSWAWFSSTK